MAAFDAAAITSKVRELAAKHEALHTRLSHAIGPVGGYAEMSLSELAKYGLAKMGIEPPEDDEAAVTALEYFLHGRCGRTSGLPAGMDAASDNFIDKYLRS